MKATRLILSILQGILATGILLLALATFLGKNYLQTLSLLGAVLLLILHPVIPAARHQSRLIRAARYSLALLLLILAFTLFSPGPKTTIYTSADNRANLLRIYDGQLAKWPGDTKSLYLQCPYGKVHVLRCGSPDLPPLVMFHAASMGAPSWKENLEPLLGSYCIYAFDNIGEGNRSELNDALSFPRTGEEIAGLYAGLLDSLGISGAPVFGASNGGYIAQVLALYHPEKVSSLALFGPMGLRPLTSGSIFMLSIGSMYPLPFVRKAVTRWALGDDEYANLEYGEWFDCIIKATIPSVAQPRALSTAEKLQVTVPVLVFLGTRDPIVGPADKAREAALEYPAAEVVVLESSHLVAVEKREEVNRKVLAFLKGSHEDPA